jgi:hypothetical protein
MSVSLEYEFSANKYMAMISGKFGTMGLRISELPAGVLIYACLHILVAFLFCVPIATI